MRREDEPQLAPILSLDEYRAKINSEETAYESLPVEESAKRANELLDRIMQLRHQEYEPLEGGVCSECERQVHRRFRYGCFALCRACTNRRRRIGEELSA